MAPATTGNPSNDDPAIASSGMATSQVWAAATNTGTIEPSGWRISPRRSSMLPRSIGVPKPSPSFGHMNASAGDGELGEEDPEHGQERPVEEAAAG